MSWITVDTDLPDHPKMAALQNDNARYGWLVVLCKAKQQRKAGTFANANHFRHVMGRHARFLEGYRKVGLLDIDETGTIHVHDWQRHQWAGTKAQQRETSDGHSSDIPETNLGPKEDASRAVSVPVSVGVVSTEGVQGEPDAFVAFHQKTGSVPGTKLRTWINELTEKHGERRVAGMIGLTPMDGTPPDYLRIVQDRLRLEDIAAERAERIAEAKRVEEKRRPVVVRPAPEDISDEEARRIAAEYVGKSA